MKTHKNRKAGWIVGYWVEHTALESSSYRQSFDWAVSSSSLASQHTYRTAKHAYPNSRFFPITDDPPSSRSAAIRLSNELEREIYNSQEARLRECLSLGEFSRTVMAFTKYRAIGWSQTSLSIVKVTKAEYEKIRSLWFESELQKLGSVFQ